MRKCYLVFLSSLITCFIAAQNFSILLPDSLGKKPLDGRLLLMFSTNPSDEPRFQIADGPGTQQIFGTDVENWQPGTSKNISASAFGYPVESMMYIPAGEYTVQVLLHVYETVHRKDGHIIKLPMDRGEGQHWNSAPGNFYSVPVKIKFNPKVKILHTISLTKVIPPIKEPEDSKYVKHIKI